MGINLRDFILEKGANRETIDLVFKKLLKVEEGEGIYCRTFR